MAVYKRAWISWSGGKDSFLALLTARATGISVEGALITINHHGYVPMHHIPKALISAQLKALGIYKHIWHCLPAHANNSLYESSLSALLTRIKEKEKVEAIIFGDIFLEDIRHYREKLLAELHLQALFPLWGQNTRKLSKKFIQSNHKAIVCTVDCRFLPPHLAGTPYDYSFLKTIEEHECDPCGENGEFHTFVYAGPSFSRQIPFRVSHHLIINNYLFSPPLTLSSALLTPITQTQRQRLPRR